jgi:hypothetical protein
MRPEMPRSQVSEVAGVSGRIVSYMRVVLKDIQGRGLDEDEIQRMSWPEARRVQEGTDTEPTPDWDEKDKAAIEQIAWQMKKVFGSQTIIRTDLFAAALIRLNEQMPQRLIYEWNQGGGFDDVGEGAAAVEAALAHQQDSQRAGADGHPEVAPGPHPEAVPGPHMLALDFPLEKPPAYVIAEPEANPDF